MFVHHLFLFYYLGLFAYFVGMWLASIHMFSTFALSHLHLDVTTERLHWVEYSFLHTMNVEPSWWCDWFMGYLNYQIEHHLFPRMPQFRQREIAPRVKALALKHNLPYHCVSYTEAIRMAIGNLSKVSHEIQNQKST